MREQPGAPEPKRPRGLGEYLWAGVIRSLRERPVSFYLLLAMIPVLLLGARLAHFKDDPRRFAFVLSLLFLFFLLVMVRGVLDGGTIVRRYLRERRDLYRTTIGDEAFMSELRKRVSEHKQE